MLDQVAGPRGHRGTVPAVPVVPLGDRPGDRVPEVAVLVPVAVPVPGRPGPATAMAAGLTARTGRGRVATTAGAGSGLPVAVAQPVVRVEAAVGGAAAITANRAMGERRVTVAPTWCRPRLLRLRQMPWRRGPTLPGHLRRAQQRQLLAAGRRSWRVCPVWSWRWC